MTQIAKQAIIDGLSLMLRPVVGFCLRHSLKLGEVTELLKIAFVRVAAEHLQRQHELVSASKLSVVTGVHRKDISRILSLRAKPMQGKGLIANVLGAWQRRRKKILSCAGKKSDFARLVSSVSADLNPYTVLFELERIQAVKRSGDTVTLLSKAFLPRGDVKEGFRMLSRDISDLIAAVEENIVDAPNIPNLHIATEYDRVPVRHLATIRSWMIEKGADFHRRAQEYLGQFDADTNPDVNQGEQFARVTIGSFGRCEFDGKGDKV